MSVQYTAEQHSRIGNQGQTCLACASRCSGQQPLCQRPEGLGCVDCKRRGLVCIVNNVALAPCEENVTRAPLRRCQPCSANNRPCDFQRNCQSCQEAGEECTGSRANCFWRGVPSTDMYGYYLNLGYGPTGVNDPNGVPGWQQPADYHLQYVQGLINAGGANNLNTPLVASHPHINRYQQALEVLNLAISQGVPADLQAASDRLTADLNAWKPITQSQAYNDLWGYVKSRTNSQNRELIPERAIEYPEGTDFSLLQSLNPGRHFQGYLAPLASFTHAPLDRPVSPGPARPQYFLPIGTREEYLDVVANDTVYPPDHPELTDMTKLQRPLSLHPCRLGQSPVSSIPYKRVWDNGVQYSTEQYCQATIPRPTSGVCANPTHAGCEDDCHYGSGFPICDKCELESRNRFMEHFDTNIVMNIRAWACATCTSDPEFVGRFENSGQFIWWAYGEFPYTEPPDMDVTDVSLTTAGGQKVGGWMGAPLDITGCSCALKLFGRRICSPHRLQYMLKMDEAAQKMREYVIGIYGKMVCPFCCKRCGVDGYDFKGEIGREGLPKAYVCLCCHGVVLDNRTGRAGPFPVISLNSQAAPLPFNPGQEEVNSRVLKNPTTAIENNLLTALSGSTGNNVASGST